MHTHTHIHTPLTLEVKELESLGGGGGGGWATASSRSKRLAHIKIIRDLKEAITIVDLRLKIRQQNTLLG